MRTKFILLLLALLPLSAFAQNTPVGKWRTIDDKTGKVKSIVEIYETTDGTLAGKVVQVLDSDKGPNPLCDACKGANHNKPITGMVIAWGLRHEGNTWDDGRILDPKNGKVYSAKMTPVEQGAKLEVRGYMGFSLLGRSQTWVREAAN
ncbi:DUF2147 domain-containing protein [Cognatiluteimonas profundi]|uniref:DUF2147 domain-containing protein n=1 Tax=Cognatiluteimonas profundi TaxID=2594501 RepID=UPI00131DBBDE|nr:DUF2147 domain-containing protein [Lysobacter profundi]